MTKKWMVGEIKVDSVVHVAVYEPIPGERRKVKTIALCGKVGAPDERESVLNAMQLAQTPQMILSMRWMSTALENLEKRFETLEAMYFAATSEPAPACKVGEITRAQAAREHGKQVLKAAGM